MYICVHIVHKDFKILLKTLTIGKYLGNKRKLQNSCFKYILYTYLDDINYSKINEIILSTYIYKCIHTYIFVLIYQKIGKRIFKRRCLKFFLNNIFL